jgi:hypothetical protein
MSPPRVESTITLGNLITIAVLVFGGGTAWATMRAENQATRDLIAVQERRIDDMTRGASDRELRIRSLELGAGRTDEKLVNILAGLSRIEEQLRAGQP